MLVLCLAVFAPLLLAGGNCQVNDCDLVRVGLEPVLAPCRTSVETCVSSEASFATFTDVFCRSEARNQFNNFLDCEGRPFTDQTFGAICGGPSCAGPNQTFSQCELGEGERCYDDPVVGRNSGTAAFEACLCSNNSQSSTNPECPTECAEELEQLVDDVGCCVNTGVYAFYFGTCGDSPDEGTDFQANVDVLNSLFDACGVPLPATCLHPFSVTDVPGVSAASGVAVGVPAYSIMLLYAFL